VSPAAAKVSQANCCWEKEISFIRSLTWLSH